MRLISLLALAGLIALPASAQTAAQTATQTSTQPAAPVELRFADFFAQPIGPRGLEPSAALLAARGRDVRLVGFMVQREQPQAGRFLLTPRPVALSEHADGDADDLPAATVTVLLPEAQRERFIAHQPGPVALTGRLEYGPAEDDTGRVSWVRLHLAPDALAAQASAAATHSH
jgi:hypothetical protein